MLRAALLCLVAISVWTPTTRAATEKPARPAVQYRDGRVTAKLEKAPLNVVLKELAQASHAELRGPVDDPQEVTADLQDVSLQEALERLLGEHNFTLRYEQGRLKTIEVKGVRQAQKPKKADAESGETNGEEPAKFRPVYQVFNSRGPVPVDGKLSKETGDTGRANWDMLVNTAIANEDPRVRRAAVRAGMKVLKDDPEFRDSVLAAVGSFSNEDLATLARRDAHYRAEDLVKNILRESSDREIRTRAAAVLTELRKMPYKGPIVPMH